jgi:hypothetical protein
MLDLVDLSWFVYKIRSCVFRGLFVPLFPVRFRGFEWVSSRISLRKTGIDVSCIFVIDLVPSNTGKPLRFAVFRLVL